MWRKDYNMIWGGFEQFGSGLTGLVKVLNVLIGWKSFRDVWEIGNGEILRFWWNLIGGSRTRFIHTRCLFGGLSTSTPTFILFICYFPIRLVTLMKSMLITFSLFFQWRKKLKKICVHANDPDIWKESMQI